MKPETRVKTKESRVLLQQVTEFSPTATMQFSFTTRLCRSLENVLPHLFYGHGVTMRNDDDRNWWRRKSSFLPKKRTKMENSDKDTTCVAHSNLVTSKRVYITWKLRLFMRFSNTASYVLKRNTNDNNDDVVDNEKWSWNRPLALTSVLKIVSCCSLLECNDFSVQSGGTNDHTFPREQPLLEEFSGLKAKWRMATTA